MHVWLACAVMTISGGLCTAREYHVAGAVVSVDDRCVVSVHRGDETVVAAVRLWLAGPGWKSTDTRAARIRQTGVHRGSVWSKLTMTEPVSGKDWEVVVQVRPVSGGVEVTYRAVPLAEMEVNELSIIADLPLEYWRGKRAVLWPVREVRMPETLPPNHHFASAHCTALVLGSGRKRLTLRTDRPRRCTLQDARKWGTEQYNAFFQIIPSGTTRVRAGEEYVGGITLLAKDDQRYPSLRPSGLKARGRLRIGGVRASSLRVRRWEKVELAIDLSASYDNPFDPEQIDVRAIFQCPNGDRREVPAFFWAGYERRLVDGACLLVPTGRAGWRVRFTPTEPGDHVFRIVARDRSGQVEWGPGKFACVAGTGHGFLRRSEDRRYFRFDDGSPYFAVGENLCWYRSARRTYDYDEWLAALHRAGANYIRLWMPSWAFGIEWERPGTYRLDRAWELDYVLDQCQRLGIYAKLCLENFRRFDDGANPYDVRNGGPCKTVRDFFEKPEARALFKRRLRYIVARWSYSPAIMAWELWNEINCVQGYKAYSDVVTDWTREMAQYLRSIDPNHHLTVNSLGSSRFDARLWSMDEMDFAQMHGYYGWSGYDETRDMAYFIPEWLDKIDDFGKPFLFAEFGIIREKPEPRQLCDKDRYGVHLHNGLWSAAMYGAAGGAMLWWWDSYVHPNNLYSRFTSLARFAADVPWHEARLERADLEHEPAELRVFALRGPGRLLFWAQNPRHTWWNVVQGNRIPPVRAASILVSGLGRGPYRLRLYDTWAARYYSDKRVMPTAGRLRIDLGDVPRDVAGKLELVR